ncbi:MAG: pseudouridine synthase [Verrucomicrobiales bacterium]|nr:pseudouridine synthase [Verrucomicrobiales bacterium]
MKMSLKILYHDQWLVVVDKPAGMLVHPGRDPEPVEQIAMKTLRDQLGQRVYPVHRLDRPTSGVLLFLLDQKVVDCVRKQFDQQLVKKTYAAVVCGETPEEWTTRDGLQKSEGEPFREAETYFVRDRICNIGSDVFSVLTAAPKTGRFHQIRKHLLSSGNPIVGDFLYGEIGKMERIAELIDQPRLMLHARQLSFTHPVEGHEIVVTSPLPERFKPF